MRLMAKPTCTSTYSPTCVSGTYSRQASRTIPPNWTLPMRIPFLSKVSITLPGIARHISDSFAQTLVGDHGLPQGKPAVIRRHLGVQINRKTATPQLYHRTAKKVQVLEAPTAQANPIRAADLRAHLADSRAQRIVKASRNFTHAPAPGQVFYDGGNHGTEVELNRVACSFKVIALFDSAFCRCLQRNGRLPLKRCFGGNTQQGG